MTNNIVILNSVKLSNWNSLVRVGDRSCEKNIKKEIQSKQIVLRSLQRQIKDAKHLIPLPATSSTILDALNAHHKKKWKRKKMRSFVNEFYETIYGDGIFFRSRSSSLVRLLPNG